MPHNSGTTNPSVNSLLLIQKHFVGAKSCWTAIPQNWAYSAPGCTAFFSWGGGTAARVKKKENPLKEKLH